MPAPHHCAGPTWVEVVGLCERSETHGLHRETLNTGVRRKDPLIMSCCRCGGVILLNMPMLGEQWKEIDCVERLQPFLEVERNAQKAGDSHAHGNHNPECTIAFDTWHATHVDAH